MATPSHVTNPRSGYAGRVLAGLQTAGGTQAGFSTMIPIWTEKAQQQPDMIVGVDIQPFMNALGAHATEESFNRKRRVNGQFTGQATYQLLNLLFQNNWGGVAPAFTLNSQIADTQWLTISWVEDRFQENPFFIVSQLNAWVHRMTFDIDARGKFLVTADWAAEQVLPAQPISVGGGGGAGGWWGSGWYGDSWFGDDWFGVQGLGPSGLPPTDQDVFDGYNTTLILDPLGGNAIVPFDRMKIVIDQRLVHDWDMCRQLYSVVKGGKTRVKVSFNCRMSDDAWNFIANAIAGTKLTARVLATTPGGHALQMDLAQTRFNDPDESLGHRGMVTRPFIVGETDAYVDDSSNFVTLSLT
jgi:hypothetical protein